MYPHERSLVQRFAGKPFTILGINSDAREELRQIIDNGTVQWPCIVDGGDTSGPIATAWKVQGWPTIYIIDGKGKIRFQPRRGQEIEEAIETLLNEAPDPAFTPLKKRTAK